MGKIALKVLIALVTGFVMWYAMYRFFAISQLHVSNPIFCSAALMIAVFVHEVGHAIAFRRYGVNSWIVFLIIAGGTMPETKSRAFRSLPWSATAAIALAGMVGNLVVLVAYLLLFFDGIISQHELSQVANMTGGLMLWNLIPWSFLDGGHFAQALFSSVPHIDEGKFVVGIATTVGIVAVLFSLLGPQSFFLEAFLIFYGLQRQAKNNEPDGPWDKKAMTPRQQVKWAEVYVALLCASIVLLALSSPFLP